MSVLEDITVALVRLRKYAEAYPWVQSVNWDKAVSIVTGAYSAGHGAIVNGYLVLFEVITPWYTDDKLLQEWLVIKVYNDHGGVSAVPQFLECKAAELGCTGVITADSSPVSIVAKAYLDAGFSKLTTSFYKVIQ